MRPLGAIGTIIFSTTVAILLVIMIGLVDWVEAAVDDSAIDTTQLSLQELMEMRIAKVVTASRHEQRITEAPASVTVITADEIRKYGYRTLADILASIPGVYVTDDRNYSYLGVRGFGRSGDYNTRMLLLIDGHRLNDNIYDSAAIGSEFPLDIDLIKHVEFVRGPGSSLYGSNAFFGVINVVTRSAADMSRELAFAGGDNETWTGRTSYGARYGSGLEVLVSGSIFDSAGERNLHYPEYAADPNGPIFRNNDYDSAKSFYSRFSFGDLTLSGLYQTREKGIPTGSFGTAFNIKPNYTFDDRGYVDLSYRRIVGEVGEITARVFYDAYLYEGRYTYDNSGALPPYVTNRDQANGRWWGAETIARLAPFKDHRVTLGAEFRQNLTVSQSNFNEDPYSGILDDNHRTINWGMFVQDEYRALQEVLLNVGIRYDNYDRFSTVNPRAALIYQPAATTTFKLIYGEAFRAPNPYESYYNDGNATSKANPALQPEKIRTYETVWEQYFGKTYNSSVSAFYYQINNLISQTVDPADTLLVYHNLTKLDARGVELALQGKWEGELNGKLSYTWQEVTSSDPETRRNSPQHLAKAHVSFPVYKTVLFISPELNYVGARETKGGNRTKDTLIANLTLFSRDLFKGLEASASVYNLFDTTYGDPGANEHLQDIINRNGIDFRMKLTYRF